MNQVTSHDMESMLCTNTGSHASRDYIGSERREVMAEEIAKINPFSKNRERIDLFDKSRGSPFSGLNMEKVDRFTDRNRSNFKRHFHEKLL